MEAISTTALNPGWWKELRVRGSGKQKGQVFACYTSASGAVFYSRTKAEQAGCVDPEPDGRTTRRKDKADKSQQPAGKAQSKPKAQKKPKAKSKPRATRKPKAKASKDPESVKEDEKEEDSSQDHEMHSDA